MLRDDGIIGAGGEHLREVEIFKSRYGLNYSIAKPNQPHEKASPKCRIFSIQRSQAEISRFSLALALVRRRKSRLPPGSPKPLAVIRIDYLAFFDDDVIHQASRPNSSRSLSISPFDPARSTPSATYSSSRGSTWYLNFARSSGSDYVWPILTSSAR